MTVSFYGSVLDYVGDERTDGRTIEMGAAPSVRALIGLLGGRYGEPFLEFLLGEDTCFFLVNGASLMATGGLDTPLGAGDTVEILPFVDGG